RFTVRPRRGELLVFDKFARPLLNHIVLAVPTGTSKGVLVAPTVFGNILVGPTAEDVERKDDASSTASGLSYLRREAARIVPELVGYDVTATYVGLRAATEHDDYQLHADDRYVCVGGIRSSRLTASLAIADHVRELLGIARQPKPPELRLPNIGALAARPHQNGGPSGGLCERVTLGRVEAARATGSPA